MATKKNNELRIVFWHNDFPDGSRHHPHFGVNGPIFKQIDKITHRDTILKWRFHGGYIHPGRVELMRRLEKADVLFAACARNMDMEDVEMHWDRAENSLLEILQEVITKNPKLKIFFLQEPYHLTDEFGSIGEFATDVHDEVIYKYFNHRRPAN